MSRAQARDLLERPDWALRPGPHLGPTKGRGEQGDGPLPLLVELRGARPPGVRPQLCSLFCCRAERPPLVLINPSQWKGSDWERDTNPEQHNTAINF